MKRTCSVEGCDVLFTPTTATQRGCSRRCRARLRASDGTRYARNQRTCEVCNQTYAATYSQQRTCGRICGAEINGRNKAVRAAGKQKWPSSRVYIRQCDHCTEWFAARTSKARCSEACAIQMRKDRQRATYALTYISTARPIECTCRECGAVFMSSNASGAQYCGKRCDRRATDRTRRHRIRAAGPSDSFTLNELGERDGWRCHLCKRKVARKSASIDHLLPIVAGGSHTWDNVALAHHLCNARRRETGPAQLLLVG